MNLLQELYQISSNDRKSIILLCDSIDICTKIHKLIVQKTSNFESVTTNLSDLSIGEIPIIIAIDDTNSLSRVNTKVRLLNRNGYDISIIYIKNDRRLSSFDIQGLEQLKLQYNSIILQEIDTELTTKISSHIDTFLNSPSRKHTLR